MSRKRSRASREPDDEMEAFMRETEKIGGESGEYQTLSQRQNQMISRISERRQRRIGRNYDDSEEEGENRQNKPEEISNNHIKQENHNQNVQEEDDIPPERDTRSLLTQAAELRKVKDALDLKSRKRLEQDQEEQALLKEANKVQKNALMSSVEIATGGGPVKREPIKTSWTCPKRIADLPEESHAVIRTKWHILVDGEDCPPPIKSFKDMKIPTPIINQMTLKNIARPTPIQVQGIPALFSGRDVIGIAFTGSGKTLTFLLPMVMHALEEEMNLPLQGGDGPIGLVLCPSRELARQTHENLEHLLEAFKQPIPNENGSNNSSSTVHYPEIRSTLIVGGEDKIQQTLTARTLGVHCIVATPGRINDLLNKQQLYLDICKYLVLDEADRMLDMGFDEEVQLIINRFKRPRQTVLFSATMPQKFQDFAQKVLIKPLLINVGRAGAANLDVIQEVEYVKKEARVVYLLECLQKTAPPVVIFSDRKSEVDEIHEYLLVKGVAAASIHGDKSQEERNEAIRQYKNCTKDVLVATDIAAKGLDFPDIQHVINFDMPTEIENYVHRIGRTGRSGKTGVATTFINKEVPESALLDLKHLLIEAKQRVPPVLQALQDPDEELQGLGGTIGCAFCGGLGHRITECPKLDKDARRIGSSKRDSLVGSDGF
jgi:ATP-dependent RNA helicase DDX41